MKKIGILVSIALVLGLVVGCSHVNDSENGGGGKVYVKPADEKTKKLGEENFTLIGIKGGSFLMGEGVQSTTRQTSVDSFLLAETEVTQAQWLAVMGSALPDPTASFNKGDGENHPMYYVSWYDAIAFCNKLSFMEGLTPVYSVKVGGEEVDWENITGALTPDVGDTDWNAVTVNSDADGYRLPTEAEWEYAAGGGDSDARTIYAGTDTGTNDPLVDDLGDYAWYSVNAEKTTHIVGIAGTESSTTPKSGNDNDLGLYDMSGNVWEWCWDWYGNYDPNVTDNPTGATSGLSRVLRGGSWRNNASSCRVAIRLGSSPSIRYDYLGLRVARSVSP